MTTIDYHDAHNAYIEACADAIRAAGYHVINAWGDPNDPRDGCIEITPTGKYAGYDELFLAWNEERGWNLVTGNGRDNRNAHDMGLALVASPSSVAREFAEMSGAIVLPAHDDHPDLDFDHEFETDDPAFEAALAHYEPTTGATP
jgi:hypothetical protein